MRSLSNTDFSHIHSIEHIHQIVTNAYDRHEAPAYVDAALSLSHGWGATSMKTLHTPRTPPMTPQFCNVGICRCFFYLGRDMTQAKAAHHDVSKSSSFTQGS